MKARTNFSVAALSTTEKDFLAARQNFPPKLISYLSKYTDEQLYISKRSGISYGKTTSAGAESGNNLLNPIRKVGMASGLLLFHTREYTRMLRINDTLKKENLGIICPRHMTDLKKKREKILYNKRPIVECNDDFIKIGSAKCGGVSSMYKICTKTWQCTCGEQDITRSPCQHLIQACDLIGHDPVLLYEEHHQTALWEKQYKYFTKAYGEWEVTTSDVKELGMSDEQGPLVIRYPKGRPKMNKRFKSSSEKYPIKKEIKD